MSLGSQKMAVLSEGACRFMIATRLVDPADQR